MVTAAAAAFAFTAAPALAAPPETPEVTAPCLECVGATGALLRGTLNPAKAGEPGETYEFVYRPSATECKGAGELSTLPGNSLGEEKEAVSAFIEGLSASTVYTFCLLAHNSADTETSVSRPVTFKTIVSPEAPEPRPATDVTATSATLNAVLDPNHPAEGIHYRFRYKQSTTECSEGYATETPTMSASGAQGEAVSQPITGLLPATTYTYCAFVRNEAFEKVLGPPETFTTPTAAPAITDEKALDEETTAATVTGTVNAGGLPTAYHVEIVSAADYASTGWAHVSSFPSPDAHLPAANTPTAVREELHKLLPNTAYDVRIVASNERGETFGPGITLTTTAKVASGTGGLTDGRQYELVSGSGNPGEIYVPTGPESSSAVEDSRTNYPLRASEDGDTVTYVGDPGEGAGGNGQTGAPLGNQFRAHRDPGRGWDEIAISPQAAGRGEAENGTEYQGFSDDLSQGVIGAATNSFATLASPQGPTSCNALYANAFDGVYHPLFTGTEDPGFCGLLPINGEPSPTQNLLFAGGNKGTSVTPTYTDLLFQTPVALTPGVASSAEGEGDNLYVSTNSKPYLISELPDGQPDANAVFGSPPVERSHHHFDFSNVISADGSLVFWTDLSSHRVYMRENPTAPESPRGGAGECVVTSDACTVPISSGEATYWTATPDGRYVFYTEGEQLWRYNTASGNREPLLQTDDQGNSAGVQGVIGASEDGSYVYVVTQGQLTANSEERTCTEASPESVEGIAEREGLLPAGRGCNLYLLRVGTGATFVAALAAKDDNLTLNFESAGTRLGAWQSDMGVRTAEVTPDGLGLVFESTQRLLRYDTSSLVSPTDKNPENRLEIFVYKADAGGGGTLSCASCEPRGLAAPFGGDTNMSVSLHSTYAPRWISDDGSRVFFNTVAPLVPQDVNGKLDVYEWEREGTAGCPEATSLYGGCVSLLSGGDSGYRSYFVDASSSGDDVFFTHRGQLGSVGSVTGKNELFDARVDGGFSESSLACAGTACQGVPPAAPMFATPSSVTFSGAGNFPSAPSKVAVKSLTRAQKLVKALKSCRKDKSKKRRAGCEKSARKRYGAAKARKASHDRRTK